MSSLALSDEAEHPAAIKREPKTKPVDSFFRNGWNFIVSLTLPLLTNPETSGGLAHTDIKSTKILDFQRQ
jgi:hypothetical protein